MMTGCCACRARSAALRSKGLMAASRSRFIIFTARHYKWASDRALLLLDHDCPRHRRVNRAKVGVGTGSARGDCELLIGIERRRFLKLLLDAHDGVRFFVPVNPGHLLSRLHGYGLGIEGEVFDLDSVLLGAVS